jgi:hypothetical protein
MKKVIIGIILVAAIFSCTKEDSLIQLKQKEWFQRLMAPCGGTICKTYIYKAVYNQETVIYTKLTGALCDPVFFITLYNLHGEVVKVYQDLALFEKEVTNRHLIYQCDK